MKGALNQQKAAEYLGVSDDIMSLEQAAAYLKLHPQTLRRSQCPRSKIGGRIVFERDVLLAWVRAHRSHNIAEVA